MTPENDEVKGMGTLLQKMTAETSRDVKFTDNQVKAMVEILIPRLMTNLPGMPAGMTCSVEGDGPGAWVVRITRPI